VRSIVGLDGRAAKRAFDGFLTGKALTANQIQFVNLVIDYLTQGGWMTPVQLYESPFTDFSPRGVEGVFDSAQVGQLLSLIDEAISDVAHPEWRATTMGVYRFWRDLGYAIAALISGIIADLLGRR
jgi:hypothetical protein